MPREQQICEQLASSLLYLFPLVPVLSITSVLLPVSNSYLTDSHWKRSAPRSTPTLKLTSLPHSASLSTQLKTNSTKSTSIPSPPQQSIHPLISPVRIQPKILHFIPFISSVSFFPPSHNTHHIRSSKHTNTTHLKHTSIAYPSTLQLSPPTIRTFTQQSPSNTHTPSHPLLVTPFPPLSAKRKRFNRSRIAQWKSNRPFQSRESLVDVSSILTSALFFSSIQ